MVHPQLGLLQLKGLEMAVKPSRMLKINNANLCPKISRDGSMDILEKLPSPMINHESQ